MDTFKLNKADGFYYAPPIDPDDTLDYKLDLAKPLDGDAIAGVVWSRDPAGITIVGVGSFTSTTASVRLTAATLGGTWTISARITTASGQVFDRSFKITCAQR